VQAVERSSAGDNEPHHHQNVPPLHVDCPSVSSSTLHVRKRTLACRQIPRR
jgi:hypothetical protein